MCWEVGLSPGLLVEGRLQLLLVQCVTVCVTVCDSVCVWLCVIVSKRVCVGCASVLQLRAKRAFGVASLTFWLHY